MDYISGWCKSKRRLDCLTAIVTGSNCGIGKQTAKDFYKRGARVIMACRDVKKAEAAKLEIENELNETLGKGTLLIEELDLARLESVRGFCSRLLKAEQKIDILINNAGVMMCPKSRTEDGFEMHIGTNHFGPALLTLLLLPTLIQSSPSRVVFVSSILHKRVDFDFDDVNYEKTEYNALKAYCKSKSANVLFSRALSLKLKEHNITGVTTYSLHPGVISTDIGRHFDETVWRGATWVFNNIMSLIEKTPACGAQTTIYCAVDEKCCNETGLYYSDCAPAQPSKFCQDDAQAIKFWDLTIEALQLQDYDPFH